MEDLLGLLVLLGVILFPIVWWFLNERGKREEQDHWEQPPREGGYPGYGDSTISSGMGSQPGEPYGARAESRSPYGGPAEPTPYRGYSVDAPPAPPPWEEQHAPHVEAPPRSDTRTMEERYPALERDDHEPPARHEEGPVTRRDSIVDGGPQVREPARPSLSLSRRGGNERPALVALLRSRRGLRQAMLVQAVLGKPKGLESDQDEAPLAR